MATLTVNLSLKNTSSTQAEATFMLVGDLDNSTVSNLEAKMKPVLAAKPAQVIFDLAGLKFVTSAGIRLFFIAVKQQKQHGGHTSFIRLQPQIKEVFAIMGSIPDMSIFQDQAELDAYLLARQRTYQQ